jgi:hypothetical protein
MGNMPATQYLPASVTDKFDISEGTANDSSRGLAYSSKMDPRHGPLFTLHSGFTIFLPEQHKESFECPENCLGADLNDVNVSN